MLLRIPAAHPPRRGALPPDQLVPGGAGIAAQVYLSGGAAEVEVPLGEQGGYLSGIDAAWRRAAAAGKASTAGRYVTIR